MGVPAAETDADLLDTSPLPMPGLVAGLGTLRQGAAGPEGLAAAAELGPAAEGLAQAPGEEGSAGGRPSEGGCLGLNTLMESTPEFSRATEIMKSSGVWVGAYLSSSTGLLCSAERENFERQL
jgi:hypothetical protein